jgi:hypothetical protein
MVRLILRLKRFHNAYFTSKQPITHFFEKMGTTEDAFKNSVTGAALEADRLYSRFIISLNFFLTINLWVSLAHFYDILMHGQQHAKLNYFVRYYVSDSIIIWGYSWTWAVTIVGLLTSIGLLVALKDFWSLLDVYDLSFPWVTHQLCFYERLVIALEEQTRGNNISCSYQELQKIFNVFFDEFKQEFDVIKNYLSGDYKLLKSDDRYRALLSGFVFTIIVIVETAVRRIAPGASVFDTFEVLYFCTAAGYYWMFLYYFWICSRPYFVRRRIFRAYVKDLNIRARRVEEKIHKEIELAALPQNKSVWGPSLDKKI